MSGIATSDRRSEDVFAGLTAWFRRHHPELEGVHLSSPRLNDVGGFSSDSLMFSLSATREGETVERALVVRLPPGGEGVFRDYDLEQQYVVQHALEPTAVPVAHQVAYEGDRSWLGAPFILMDLVAGQVPASQPPFYKSGWMVDLPVPARARLYDHAVQSLAMLHQVRFDPAVERRAERPGGPGLDPEIAWCVDYVEWASDGALEPEVLALAQWCADRKPRKPPANVVCWGDARLGNMIFADDTSVAALLDWEMVTVAPPELDLAWFLAFRQQTRARSGGTDPELEGLMTRAQTIARYESLVGRRVEDLEWYEMYSMLRLAGANLGTKRIVRRKGITEHFIFRFAAVERWVLDYIDSH